VRVTAAPTVREALAEFRQANGLPAKEVFAASWTCRLGPLTLRLPNFKWRQDAIFAHDLHHVLTAYPCTMRGECQMAAWEFGAGPMPHWAAALFCLPLVVVGLLWTPRRIIRAFLWGRRSRSLHGSAAAHDLLAMPLHVARGAFANRADLGEIDRAAPPPHPPTAIAVGPSLSPRKGAERAIRQAP
jgi:hypothetical protein